MKALELTNVSTILDHKVLIQDISFSIESGKITALLGHNGAGKSTVMKTIMQLMEKKTGQIKILQYDQDEQLLPFKRQLAYLPEEPMLLPELTVMQHFQMYGRSYNIDEETLRDKTKVLVKEFELNRKLHEYPENLSKGMRQKVQTICALLPDVAVLLIDEPFMGLDVYAMEYVICLLKEKSSQGTGILLTTHQLEHAKALADDFILLRQGEMTESGPISAFDSITRGFAHD